jgi:hypothetical protein
MTTTAGPASMSSPQRIVTTFAAGPLDGKPGTDFVTSFFPF